MKSPKVVQFTRIKAWYMPVTADDYKALRDIGIPTVRIHENLMPTMALVFKKHKIKPEGVNFTEAILDPYLDELGTRWQKKEHRKASLSKSVLKFETTHSSALNQAREALPKLEASLRRFFQRWGFLAVFETSESRGKIKLHVQYKHDADKSPIIPLVEDVTSLPQIKLDLGYVRLALTLMQKEIEVNVSIAAGTQWTSIHTSRCLYSQISDVRPMLNSLVQIVNKDQHNEDNKTK